MEKNILEKVNIWLGDGYDVDTQNEIQRLMKEDEAELGESFYRNLEFGTGGLRGIMGVGTNRMNRYTVGAATQGLANYLHKNVADKELKVVVSHDSRNNSRYFAEVTAQIFAANGIHCYLFEDLRPTPELSFAVRHLHCHAGVMVTASHNPKEYNGYKVYWADGGQLVSPHDKGVISEVNAIQSVNQVCWAGNPDKIQMIGKEVDDVYLSKVKELSLNPDKIQKQHDLKIVYSPLHGTGITLVPKALQMFGFTNVTIVEEQSTPDGNFPTVASPNPEEKVAMELAIQTANRVKADLVLATDPDADRVGIAVRNDRGEMELFNGNMTGSLLVDYVLSQWQNHGLLTGKEFAVKTIVTTELIREIADNYQVPCDDVLTGFKYIAEKIENEPNKTFVVGGEESYGYLTGSFVRDKDAVSACCMIAELAAFAKDSGMTMYDCLKNLYVKYSFYQEGLLSVTKKGQAGAAEIQKMMENFRAQPPKILGGSKVVKMMDYQSSVETNLITAETKKIALPKSNVLQFFAEDGTKVTIRPSGTEPKIKFYFGVKTNLSSVEQFDNVKQQLTTKIESLKKEIVGSN